MKAIPESISRKAKKLVKKPDAFVKDMKLVRWGKALLSSGDFSVLVVFPFLISMGYLTVIASDRFVSESSFIVQSEKSASGAVDGLSLLGIGRSTVRDERVIEEYIHSLDLLKKLDSKLSLKNHYSNDGYDPVFRLSENPTQEKFLTYYRNHTKIHFDESRGMLKMEVESFSPEYSQKLALELLKAAEGFVNQYSFDLANNQQHFVAEQVSRLERKLRNIKQKMLSFQNSAQVLSPETEGSSLGSIVSKLEARLAELKTQHRELLSYQHASAPAPMAIERQINALKHQISEEKTKLVSNDGKALNQKMAEYQSLKLDLEFATRSYESAMVALENARMEASRQLKHLVTISQPQISEEAAYPRKTYLLATMLLVQLMLFSLYRMIRATIREHQD